jgi:hypothetical protein
MPNFGACCNGPERNRASAPQAMLGGMPVLQTATYPQDVVLTTFRTRIILRSLFGAAGPVILRSALKREPGVNPGLSRSGKQERKLNSSHWSSPDWEA